MKPLASSPLQSLLAHLVIELKLVNLLKYRWTVESPYHTNTIEGQASPKKMFDSESDSHSDEGVFTYSRSCTFTRAFVLTYLLTYLLTLGGLQINKRYARKFDEINKRKDLQRAKELGLNDESDGSIDSEDAESEDDDAELLTTSLDLQIVKTINSIRKKDPKIYEKNNVWFEGADDDEEDDDDEDGEDDRGKDDESGKKPKRYKDVLREQLLSKGADIEDSDVHGQRNNETKKKNKLIYDHEQEKMRKEFLQTIADNDSDAASSDEMTLQGTHSLTYSLTHLTTYSLTHSSKEEIECRVAERAGRTAKSVGRND